MCGVPSSVHFLNDTVECCFMLNEIITHHVYLEQFFFHSRAQASVLFCCKLFIPASKPGIICVVLLSHSLPTRLTVLVVYQETCRKAYWLQYTFPLCIVSFFLKELCENCQTSTDTSSWLYPPAVKVSSCL